MAKYKHGEVFWARSKRRYGYEVMFHALKVGENSLGIEHAVRLCQPNTIRGVDRLLPGNPRDEFRCQFCEAEIAKVVRQRIEQGIKRK